jgi:oxygen-dependent protoporphyrinogen oxidase
MDSHGESKSLNVDGIVCATTASVVPTIFPQLTTKQTDFFKPIEYSSTALVARTYKVGQGLHNKSIAFPRQGGTILSSVTLSHDHDTRGSTLATIKTYASGRAAKELTALSDEALMKKLASATEPIHDELLVGEPKSTATHVQRWQEALPFFDVGHFKRLAEFENGEVEDQNTGITFAGDYIGGPFMEGAFTSGVRAAERLHLRLQK